MKSWFLLFLVFIFLILLYSLHFTKTSYTTFSVRPGEEKNISGWYVLGKVKIESGKIANFSISQEKS